MVNQINSACPSDHNCCGSVCCDTPNNEVCEIVNGIFTCVQQNPTGSCCYCSSASISPDESSPRCQTGVTEQECMSGTFSSSFISFIRWQENGVCTSSFCDENIGGSDDTNFCN